MRAAPTWTGNRFAPRDPDWLLLQSDDDVSDGQRHARYTRNCRFPVSVVYHTRGDC